jgi:phosphatidylglycerophosphate synthase
MAGQSTWAHVAVRPIVRLVVDTPITPNHLTVLRLLTGLSALWCFARGIPSIGGSFFIVSAFLDRADGELARLSGKTSQRGHRFDYFSDIVITTLTFVCIAIGVRVSFPDGWSVTMGGVAGFSIALIFPVVAKLESLESDYFAGIEGFDPDDILFLVGPIAWFGWLDYFLVLAAVGAPIFLAVILGSLLRRNLTAQQNLPGGSAEPQREYQ